MRTTSLKQISGSPRGDLPVLNIYPNLPSNLIYRAAAKAEAWKRLSATQQAGLLPFFPIFSMGKRINVCNIAWLDS